MLLIWRSSDFYPKFKWNFKFKKKLKGVSALYFECFVIASPTIAAGQIYFNLTEELLVDYHLYCIYYLEIFLYSLIRTNLGPLSYINSQSQLTGQHQLLLFKYISFGSLYCRLLLQGMA